MSLKMKVTEVEWFQWKTDYTAQPHCAAFYHLNQGPIK